MAKEIDAHLGVAERIKKGREESEDARYDGDHLPALDAKQARQFLLHTVRQAARDTRAIYGAGTTLSLAYNNPETQRVTAANVGDSPIYLVCLRADGESEITPLYTEFNVATMPDEERERLRQNGAVVRSNMDIHTQPNWPESDAANEQAYQSLIAQRDRRIAEKAEAKAAAHGVTKEEAKQGIAAEYTRPLLCKQNGANGMQLSRALGARAPAGGSHTPALHECDVPQEWLSDADSRVFLITASDGALSPLADDAQAHFFERLKKAYREDPSQSPADLAKKLLTHSNPGDDFTLQMLELKPVQTSSLLAIADGHGDGGNLASGKAIYVVDKEARRVAADGPQMLSGLPDQPATPQDQAAALAAYFRDKLEGYEVSDAAISKNGQALFSKNEHGLWSHAPGAPKLALLDKAPLEALWENKDGLTAATQEPLNDRVMLKLGIGPRKWAEET